MASYGQVIDRWIARETGKTTRRNLLNRRMPARDGTLYSYGSHFELVESVRDTRGRLIAFLCNGDRYSVSTNRHQRDSQSAVQGSGIPAFTVPFTAMARAGIDRRTVRPIEVRP